MHVRWRFIVGVGVIAVAVAYLVITAVRNTAEYYLTVDEVGARQTELAGQSLRIAGRVKPGTINWDPATLTLAFTMVAIPQPDGGAVKTAAAADSASFHVICRGQPKPDMLADNRDVIVEGKLAGGNEVAATQVLTSCPSKYVPKQKQ
jgi:cytochrome c-type biogenesis protein CcmE